MENQRIGMEKESWSVKTLDELIEMTPKERCKYAMKWSEKIQEIFSKQE